MRICHITSGHKPNDDRIFYKEARSLSKKYDDIWIISPFSKLEPMNKEGIHFKFIKTKPGTLYNRYKIIRELIENGADLKADVYHCHEPESLFAAIHLKKRFNCRVVFDSHELYKATVSQKFPPGTRTVARNAYAKFESLEIKACDYIIGATWSISKYFEKEVRKDKIATILNGALPDIMGPGEISPWLNKVVICHEGSLTFERGLKSIVEAIRIVANKHRIILKIIGDVSGAEKIWLQKYIDENNIKDLIEVTGWLDYRKVHEAIRGCNIGLIAFDKRPNHEIAAPNKLFNYLHFGIPVIAPEYCLNIKKIIEDDNCGIMIKDCSAMSFAGAISHLIIHKADAIEMGRNGQTASNQKYAWPVMEIRLNEIYKQIEVA